MNCFAHALPFLDQPHFAVGACVPDWLSMVDRKCRARQKRAARFVDHENPVLSRVARGVVQHHQDDDWFHRTRVFNEMMLRFAMELRELSGNERSMRTGFVSHVVIEMLLDAYLSESNPGQLELFYHQVSAIDPNAIQQAVNQFATRRTERLVEMIPRFVSARYIFDYLEDTGIQYRMNRILERIGLDPMDDALLGWLPSARRDVYNHASELLEDYALEV